MKLLFKRITCVLLTISFVCSTLPVVAFADNIDNINLTAAVQNNTVTMPETLPQLNDNGIAVDTSAQNTIYDNIDFEQYDKYDGELQLNMPPVESVELPEIPEEGSMELLSSNASEYASFRIGQINNRDSFALENQTGRTNFSGDKVGEEYIDPLTGNLIVTETDLVLPGRDGFDLKLSRYYSLAEAELFTKAARYVDSNGFFVVPAGWYIVTETVRDLQNETEEIYYYAYETQEDANKRYSEIETRDTCNGKYDYIAETRQTTQEETITNDYYITSELISSSHQIMKSNLGAGWSWSFPSVQVVNGNYTSDTFVAPEAIYYHDGKGNVMEIKNDGVNDCSFVNYTNNDITFEMHGKHIEGIAGVRIDYIVEDADLKKYYFGRHGEIRAIQDAYGNIISFSYSAEANNTSHNIPLITGITDSVGRIITFTYSKVEAADGKYNNIDIEVKLSPEDDKAINLKYEKKILAESNNNPSFYDIDVLEKVIYPNGEQTAYYPAEIDGTRNYFQPLKFSFSDKSLNSSYLSAMGGTNDTYIYLLGNIVRPRSITQYCYEKCERNLGHSGVSEAYRINRREDMLFTVNDSDSLILVESRNVISHSYTGDYTGYPEYFSIDNIPEYDLNTGYSEFILKTHIQKENSSEHIKYGKIDGSILEVSRKTEYDNPVGNNLTRESIVQEFSSKQPVRTIINYSNGSVADDYSSYLITQRKSNVKASGKITLQSKEISESVYTNSEVEHHSTQYTYDSNTGFLLTKSWYQSEFVQLSESFEYNDQKRLEKYTSADNAVTTYSYEYVGSKVSKKTTTTVNDRNISANLTDRNTTTVIENFTAETNYTFPSTVVKNVKNRNTTTTQTATYTYDMLYGVVTSMTDNDGNTTYYEYDQLGRLIKTIYPVYSTYNSFANKSIKILPIETVSYKTVKYEEYSGISSYYDLVTLEAITELAYYDVSNIDITDSVPVDVSTLTKTFYAIKANYYLGTGELIVSKVLDTVDNAGTVNITVYCYNTSNNTVTETNANGNSTTTQYDDLGRVVKVTDQFDNYYITEYNVSGDGTGFKALTYFVPSGSRNQQKNVIEYTLDRLGRTVSEKHYSAYPNEYAEIKYEYDNIGNVTKIIDANGNEQTYTYDALNRVVSSINPNNEYMDYAYDNFGNIKEQAIVNQNGSRSLLYVRSYNGEGKILSDKDNANNSNLYSYDNMGRLSTIQDKASKVKAFGYNELGMLDSENSAIPGGAIIAKKYMHTSPYGAGMVYSAKGAYNSDANSYGVYISETTSNLYSPTGKIIQQYSSFADNTGIDGLYFQPYVGYTYDGVGNVTSAEYGTFDNVNNIEWIATTHYEYNKNRLSKVQIDGADTKNTADSVNVLYEYYDDGKLKSVKYPALTDNTILKSEYEYDGLSRLKKLTNYKGAEVLSSYSYTYDNNGNILTVSETMGSTSHNTVYTYDKLNRISTASGTKGVNAKYEYDIKGNRILNYEQEDFLNEENASFNYNTEDKLYYSLSGNNSTYIGYSENGYRYVKQENNAYPEFYIYDSQGRLLALAEPVELTYTDEDTNTSKKVTTLYPATQYIWGSDRVLAKIDKMENKSYYYLYNGHGDVVQIVDTSGNIVNQYDYDIWGNFLTKEETIENHFTYFGQTYDESTGLYYLRARYYDPTTGRFTQQDTAEDGYNWYVYGNQNPIKYVDPSGKVALTASAGATLLYKAAPYIIAGATLLYKAAPYIIAGATAVIGAGIMYYKEHTKGARGSTHDKHTKKRSGAPSKASKKPGWKDRSNKKKPQ